MSSHSVVVLFTFVIQFSFLNKSIFCAAPAPAPAPPSIEEGCKGVFGRLGVCLPYVSGKAESPTKNCCSTVQDIKDRHNVVCLCFIIQQTHAGAPSLKQLGLQVPKLIQLPSVCNLANVTVGRCPQDLKLSPDSPDYGIFGNSSLSSPATGTGTGTGTSSSPKKDESSTGFVHGPLLTYPIAAVIAMTVAMLISVFPM